MSMLATDDISSCTGVTKHCQIKMIQFSICIRNDVYNSPAIIFCNLVLYQCNCLIFSWWPTGPAEFSVIIGDLGEDELELVQDYLQLWNKAVASQLCPQNVAYPNVWSSIRLTGLAWWCVHLHCTNQCWFVI